MPDLNAAQLRQAFDFLDNLRDCEDIETFGLATVRALTQLIDCDLIGYNEIAPTHGRLHALVSQDYPEHREIEERWTLHQGEHPTFQHHVTTGDRTAWRISDFMTRRAFRATGLYQDCYRLMGNAQAHLSVALDAPPGVVVALAFNRSSGDFTQAERDVLNLVRPHLSRAYNRASAAAQLSRRAARATAALESLDDGVIAVDEDGERVLWSTAPARRLLAEFFGTADDILPPRLRSWLAATTPGSVEPFVIAAGGARLVIHATSGGVEGERLLLLSERRPLPTSSDGLARRLQLTAREADVLLGLMHGNTTPDIARALACAPRTIEKHVENLFRKLDVTTRTAAVARAMLALGDAR